MNTLVYGSLGSTGVKVTAKIKGWKNYKVGDTAGFSVARKHFFDKETTKAIRGGK